jgi:glutathione S-transferase
MIRLVTFPPAFGLPTITPFGLKIETYLHLAKIPFERVAETNPRKGPKGKLPFLIDDHRVIGDSEHIIEYLDEKFDYPIAVPADPGRRAVLHALRRMLEESFYWVLLWSRWMDDSNWPSLRAEGFRDLSAPLRLVVPSIARSMIRKQLCAQGYGRHTRDQIYRIGLDDLDAVSRLLGAAPYLGGDVPTVVDATTYAFLANVLLVPLPSPLKDRADSLDNLVAYTERMRALCFPPQD